MATQDGTVKRQTFNCPQCGGFLWTEGLCDPCKGEPFEQDTPSMVENVIYKYSDSAQKVTTRARKK